MNRLPFCHHVNDEKSTMFFSGHCRHLGSLRSDVKNLIDMKNAAIPLNHKNARVIRLPETFTV